MLRQHAIETTGQRLGALILTAALLLLGTGRASANPRSLPRGPIWIHGEGDIEVLVYPPRSDIGPQPVLVMLHGMCDEPENECPYFAESATRHGWLLCPRARLRCEGGGSIWHYPRRHETVRESVRAVRAAFPDLLDESSGKTLIGFSLGGIFGMDVAHRGEDDYRRVVLIGARVYPRAELLRTAGVQRLVLAAGERDMMHWHMRDQAHRVGRHGVTARFVSLGNSGHWFPLDLTERMDAILDWVTTE